MNDLSYKKIFDFIKSPVLIVNPKEIIDTNVAFLELIKVNEKRELNEIDVLKDLISNVITCGENKTYRSIMDKQGNTIFIEIIISLLNKEEQIFVLEFKPIEDETLYNEITIISTYNRELFNNSPDSIVIVDNNNKIVDVNNAFVETFEYSHYEAIGKSIDDLLVREEDKTLAKEFFHRVLSKEKMEVISKRLTKSKRLLDVKIIAYHVLIDKRINGNYIIYKDITEEKEKDKLLNEKDEFLNQLFNRSLYPIAILDKEERILDVNIKFEELFEYSKTETAGKDINSLIVPKEYKKEAKKFKDVILKKEAMQEKTKRNNKYGELIDVEAVANPVIIGGTVVGLFAMYRDTRVEESAFKELRRLLHTDSLTGLLNRQYIYDEISNKLAKNIAITLLYFDMDEFKKVNDEFGHETGDKLLVEIAQRLTNELNNTDIEIARIGGDEFLALLKDVDLYTIELYINRIIEIFEREYIINGNKIRMSVSVGYSKYPNDGKNKDELISKADFRMYDDKKRKRILRNPVRKDPDILD